MLGLLERVRREGRSAAAILGVLLTMYDPAVALAREVAEEVAGHFGEAAFATRIPRDAALSEAPGHGRSIFHYRIRSAGAWAYLRLTMEVLRRG